MRSGTSTIPIFDLLEQCKDRPALFNEMILNRPPYWSRQKDLCRSVVKYRTTVAHTGNMVGKDYWMKNGAIHFLVDRASHLLESRKRAWSQMALSSAAQRRHS